MRTCASSQFFIYFFVLFLQCRSQWREVDKYFTPYKKFKNIYKFKKSLTKTSKFLDKFSKFSVFCRLYFFFGYISRKKGIVLVNDLIEEISMYFKNRNKNLLNIWIPKIRNLLNFNILFKKMHLVYCFLYGKLPFFPRSVHRWRCAKITWAQCKYT